MSKKSKIRTVPLYANCDLTMYNQDIHDYQGFAETNSLFLNKRITNWWKRSDTNNRIYGDVTWKDNGDNFDIYNNGNFVMSVSKNYYRLNQVDSYPPNAIKIDNKIGARGYYYFYDNKVWGQPTSVDFFQYQFSESDDNWVIIHTVTDNRFYVYKNDVLQRTIQGKGTASGGHASICMFNSVQIPTVKMTSPKVPLHYGEDEDDPTKRDITLNFGGNGIVAVITEGIKDGKTVGNDCVTWALSLTRNMELYPESIIQSDSLSYATRDINWNKSVSSSSSSDMSIYFFVNSLAPAVTSYNTLGTFSCSYGKNITGSIFDAYRFYCSDVINGGVVTYDNVPSNFVHDNGLISLSSYIRKNTYIVGIKFEVKDSVFAHSVVTGATTLQSNYSVIDNTLGGDNYSELYGQFAINYVKGTPENVAHNYKKLAYLNGKSDCYYTDDKFYFDSNNKIYELSIETADVPVYQVINEYYIVFNTTNYNNAYAMGENTVFCANDDWNNRTYWKIYGTYTKGNINSRANNNWQTTDEIATVSAQYGSIQIDLPINASTKKIEPARMSLFFTSAYKTPASETFTDADGNTVTISATKYDVYFPDEITTDVAPAMVKQGYIQNGTFYREQELEKVYVDAQYYEDTPPLLLTSYLKYNSTTIYVDTERLIYKLLAFSDTLGGRPFLIFTNQGEQLVNEGDKHFLISGSEYIYRAETNTIYDSENRDVCDTTLFIFIGSSTKMAYFYCKFDHMVYGFSGANVMSPLMTLEKYKVKTSIDSKSGIEVADALNIPSIDLVGFNLVDKLGILYNNQFCVLPVNGEITTMTVEESYGNIIVNGVMYSLMAENYDDWEMIPIEFTTEFYGNENSETNNINDTVYITVDNVGFSGTGRVEFITYALQNNEVIKSKKNIVELKKSDFNSEGTALIKYQPEIQECYGFRLWVKSDFEIADIKIGTQYEAENQTTVRT